MMYLVTGRGCGKTIMRIKEIDKILKQHPDEKIEVITIEELKERIKQNERTISIKDNSQRDQALGS